MILTPGITSVIKHVFLQDSAVTTGAGKTALAYTDITAYYVRAGGTLTQLTMETIATLGTWASTGDNYLGFKKLDDTNAPGVYELNLPNNILAAGVNQVTIQLRATGMAPCNIEIQLKDLALEAGGNVAAIKADVEHATYGLNALLAAIGTRMATFTYTAPDSAATVAAAVWNYLTASMTTVNSIGKKLADWVIGTIDTYTGNTKQTGDAFALLGTVRGTDNDTLKTLSDQIDTAQADLDNPSQYKATGFATPTNVSDAQTAIINAMPSITGLALEDTLTAMKGAGWTTETLKGIREAIANIPAPDISSQLEALLLAIQGTAGPTLLELGDAIEDIVLEPVQIFQGLALTVNSNLLTVTLDGVASKLTLKQGEAKTITFTVKDAAGVAVNLSAATLTLGVKKAKTDTAYALTKADGVFGKTQAALGIVTVALAEADTDLAEGTYIGELELSWTGGTVIEKTADFYLQIKGAVIPPA